MYVSQLSEVGGRDQSALNGHRNIFRFCGKYIVHHHATLASVLNNITKYQILIDKLGLDNCATNLIFDRRSSNSRVFVHSSGMNLPSHFFRKDLVAFCPECLRESLYWRQRWLIYFYTACVKHKCKLLYCCQNCNAELRIDRENIHICSKCDADITMAISPKVDATCSEWIMEIIENSKTGHLRDVTNFYATLKYLVADEYEKMKITYLYFCNRKTAEIELAQILTSTAHKLHPRIQIVPLLLQPLCIGSFVRKVLAIPIVEKSLVVKNENVLSLNKAELRAVLDLSEFWLKRVLSEFGIASLRRDMGYKYEAEDIKKLLLLDRVSYMSTCDKS